MKTRLWLIIGGAALALTMALLLPYFFTAPAFGQVSSPDQTADLMAPQYPGPGAGRQRGQGQRLAQGQQMGRQQSLLAVAAQVLGISQDELLSQLGSDKSIADVAGDKAQLVIDSFVQQNSARITAMVSDGRLTQADADQRLAVMKGMVTGRVYQIWATGVQGPPEGMGPSATQGAGQGQGQGRGHGQGRGVGAGNGTGNDSVDANGDGVCDHAGSGQGAGRRNGR